MSNLLTNRRVNSGILASLSYCKKLHNIPDSLLSPIWISEKDLDETNWKKFLSTTSAYLKGLVDKVEDKVEYGFKGRGRAYLDSALTDEGLCVQGSIKELEKCEGTRWYVPAGYFVAVHLATFRYLHDAGVI